MKPSSSNAHPADARLTPTHNLNVLATTPLIVPRQLKAQLPASTKANQLVAEARQTIDAIAQGRDDRLLVVTGPCSIHDVDAAMEYARRLAELRQRYLDRFFIVMRVYFEKPRTTVGWKGLINDPHLDGSFDMAYGLTAARKLLLAINELGLPVGTEMLDPITPQYIDDLVGWASIGARTTESQTHRQMASGLSMPVGYKNSTDGNLQVAIDAMKSAQHPHHFLGIDEDGRTCIVATRGNRSGHLILRGGKGGPNYEQAYVEAAVKRLTEAKLDPVMLIDCSHANSSKQYQQQETVWRSVIQQRLDGQRAIMGTMIESNLHEGRQDIPLDKEALRYGVSITDACLGWEKTATLLKEGYEALGDV